VTTRSARPFAGSPAFRARGAWTGIPVGVIEATGPDALTFVDHFTTASLGGLPAGGGTEGFFTDARGWVLALATLLRTETGLRIVTDATLAAGLLTHLEHHHIRERVELRDVTATTEAAIVAGPGAEAVLAGLCESPLPTAPHSHAMLRCGGLDACVVRVAGQGVDGYRIEVPTGQRMQLAEQFAAAGLADAAAADLEPLRIEAGYPAPADILPRTLPQELGRDGLAISFTKGCYLGQETVARLDALGHVNRRLAILAIDSAAPPEVPAPIRRAGAEVGILTSACESPAIGGPAGLGLVQVKALDAGGLQVGDAATQPWRCGQEPDRA